MTHGSRPAQLLRTLTLIICGTSLLACGGGDSDDKAPLGSESNPIPALPNPAGTRTPPVPDPDTPGVREATARAEQGESTLADRQNAAQKTADKRRAAAAEAMREKTTRRARGKQTLPTTTPVSARRPCTLVSRAAAQSLMGTPIIEPVEAPQGPTCIYRTQSGKRFVTLSVQTVSFKKLRAQMRGARRVDVSDKVGYCGRLGQPMLYLPLSAGRVLSISAPCALASRFAAEAVPRLPGS